MGRISKSKYKSFAYNSAAHHMNKYAVILLLITILMVSVACSLFHSEKDEASFQQEIIGILGTEDVSEAEPTEAFSSAQEPAQSSGPAQGSAEVSGVLGTDDYLVTSENFTCTCQEVTGVVTKELRVVDDHLEIVDADGNVRVYDKIGENTYKKSVMGYYILVVDGQDTKVDREESTVVTLTDDGYTMSNYQGEDSSPCCIYTFTQTD